MIDRQSIRVAIADDHAGMLKVVSRLLSQHFHVIASVSSGEEMCRTVVRLRPDVIVSDIDMPVQSGLEVMLWLKALGFEIPFVLMGTETKGVAHFLEQGAAAYVHKFDIFADLIEAVLLATSGKKFVSRSVVGRVS